MIWEEGLNGCVSDPEQEQAHLFQTTFRFSSTPQQYLPGASVVSKVDANILQKQITTFQHRHILICFDG